MIEGMDDPALLPQEIHLWIEHHITKPISGFEHKKRPNGRCYSYSEQLHATRYQMRLIACYYLRQGHSISKIIEKLAFFSSKDKMSSIWY